MTIERRIGQAVVIESPRGERIRVVRCSQGHLRIDPLPSGWRVFAEELTEMPRVVISPARQFQAPLHVEPLAVAT